MRHIPEKRGFRTLQVGVVEFKVEGFLERMLEEFIGYGFVAW